MIIEVVPVLLTLVGIMAFIVSIIIEVIKNIKVFSAIPTDLIVIILSVVMTVAALYAYASMEALVITWYWITGAIIAGFFVAFIAMFGWERFADLWERFKRED